MATVMDMDMATAMWIVQSITGSMVVILVDLIVELCRLKIVSADVWLCQDQDMTMDTMDILTPGDVIRDIGMAIFIISIMLMDTMTMVITTDKAGFV